MAFPLELAEEETLGPAPFKGTSRKYASEILLCQKPDDKGRDLRENRVGKKKDLPYGEDGVRLTESQWAQKPAFEGKVTA